MFTSRPRIGMNMNGNQDIYKTRTQDPLERLYPIENVDLKISLIRILTQTTEQLYKEPPLSVSYFLSYDDTNYRQAPPLYEHLSVKSMSLSLCLSGTMGGVGAQLLQPSCDFCYCP